MKTQDLLRVKALLTKKEYVDVEVSIKDALDTLENRVKQAYNIPYDSYIDHNGKIQECVDYDHHNGDPEYEVLRQASDTDLEVFDVFDKLRNLINGKNI